MKTLTYIEEPALGFGFSQRALDPRDGLFLFGPATPSNGSLRVGVIGLPRGVRAAQFWIERARKPVLSPLELERSHPSFPGFQNAFHAEIEPPTALITISDAQLDRVLAVRNLGQRVFGVAGLFADALTKFHKDEERKVDVWLVVIPNGIKVHCRPKSKPPAGSSPDKSIVISRKDLEYYQSGMFGLEEFEEISEASESLQFEPNFHHQLKSRLLADGIVTQIVIEETIASEGDLPETQAERRLPMLADIAWSLSTAIYYKCGNRPWINPNAREGVCYVGLVFKRIYGGHATSTENACCAAQMFLDSGDGVVFKGAVGPWYSSQKRSFHLKREAASELLEKALSSYREIHGKLPREVFLHGRSTFDDEEWVGFSKAAGDQINLVGIRIGESNRDSLKLFSSHKGAVPRGLAWTWDNGRAYLWCKGYVPRLGTYVGKETPNPLDVQVCRGDADLRTVLQDILSLTKLNYNACRYSDGVPVTLKFADAVGEILTSGPLAARPPLPFRHYI